MSVRRFRRSVLIWQITLFCPILFQYFPLNDKEAPSQRTLWNVKEAFAQEATEGDTNPDDLDGLNTITIHEIRSKSGDWKVKGALAALEDTIPEIQAQALYTLDELEALDRIPYASIPKIATLLEHTELEVRLAAIEALGQMGEMAKPYIPELVAFLEYGDSGIRAAAAKAIGNLGENGQPYIPELIELLNDEDFDVRTSAASALHKLDEMGRSYIPKIVALLKDKEWEVRANAVSLLGNFGEGTSAYIPQITALLKDKNEEVRAAAARTLGVLGKVAEKAIPQVAPLLKDKSWSVRATAARALGDMDQMTKAHIQQIAGLLKDKKWEVQVAAIWILSRLGEQANVYIPRIVERLDDKNAQVRAAAVEALYNMDEEVKKYIPQITRMLEDKNWEVRAAAARTLGDLGEIAKPAIPQITALLDDNDWYVRSNAARALGTLGETAVAFLPQLVTLLDDEDGNVRSAATWALGNFGNETKAYSQQIVALLEDPHPGVRYGAARILGNFGKVNVGSIAAILNPIYSEPSRFVEFRFFAHFIGAGKNEVETLLQWIGKPETNYPNLAELSYNQARNALEVFDATWESAVSFENIISDLAEQVAVVTNQMKMQWKPDDLPLLQRQVQHLEAIESSHVEAVKEVLTYVEIKNEIKTLIVLVLIICLFHPLVWGILILMSPVSRHLRAFFFWNPFVRKIIGLGYIHVVLTKLPYFQQKLFEPSRKALLIDAALDDFDETAYFECSEVTGKDSHEPLLVQKAIPAIKGQILLEGDSGLGKSMFVRYLLKHSKRVAVYLPAEKCLGGIIEAIQLKLCDEINDVEFLKKLIYVGAIDICIDGLNRVSERTRARVIRFMVHSFKGNILVATQPIGWTPPATIKTYIMQPLRLDQVEDFLISCRQLFPEHFTISRSAYAKACKDYLADALNGGQPQRVLDLAQRILSNPMNLTMVALLGAYGKEPDLLHLREQHYQMMAEEYKRLHQGQSFPLVQFSEHMYQMRLNDAMTLPWHRFPDEITCMEYYKMVARCQSFDIYGNPTTEWHFRHDKIMEFFIAQAFVGNGNHRFNRHFEDLRFRGVYSLLETLLSSDKISRTPQIQNYNNNEEEVVIKKITQ